LSVLHSQATLPVSPLPSIAGAEDTQELTLLVELLNSVVVRVNDVNVSRTVYRERSGLVELALALARGAEGADEPTVLVESLDAVIGPIGNQDVAAGAVYRDAGRAPLELPITVAPAAELAEKLTVAVELLDAVLVRDVDVTLSVKGKTVDTPELPIALAATTKSQLLRVYLCPDESGGNEKQKEGEQSYNSSAQTHKENFPFEPRPAAHPDSVNQSSLTLYFTARGNCTSFTARGKAWLSDGFYRTR
jgi:hypothetical protein